MKYNVSKTRKIGGFYSQITLCHTQNKNKEADTIQ